MKKKRQIGINKAYKLQGGILRIPAAFKKDEKKAV